MAFNVLTDDFRQQLEQQRKRLIKDRDALVQAAIAQATESIDASLNHINSLLGESTIANHGSPSFATSPTTSIGKPRGRRPKSFSELNAIEEFTPEKKRKPGRPPSNTSALASSSERKTQPRITTTKVTKVTRTPKATKSKSGTKTKAPKVALTLPLLKSEFTGLTPTQAIAQVLKQVPQKVFDVDQMIQEIYGEVDPIVAARTRQRVGVMLGHGARREEFEKVQENPPLYRIAL